MEFSNPEHEVAAYSLDEVVGVLEQAELAAREGFWSVGFVTYDAAPAFNPSFVVRSRDQHEPLADLPLAWFGLFRERAVVSPFIGEARMDTSPYTASPWIATMDEDGYLYIVDRKKDIMITSSGKNIAPGYLENLLKTSRYVSQAMVFGELKKYVSALITLDEDEVVKYARDHGIVYTGFADLTKKKEIIDLLQKEIDKKNEELARVERIRRFALLEEDFLQDEDEITPTMKVKRKIVSEKYGDIIARMYAE